MPDPKDRRRTPPEPAPRAPGPIRAGRRFGRYEVVAELGRGAMGAVYRALDPESGETVALKVLLERALQKRTARARFEREADVATRLDHPGIVRVRDRGEQDGIPFIVMDFVPGESLAQRIARGPIPHEEAIALVEGVARAVGAAHRADVVHRDLKPENILIDEETGEPRVTDFGLARDLTSDLQLTVAGTGCGTPLYMSPEQARGRGSEVDARSDVFTLGVVLYEAITGKRPFEVGGKGLPGLLEWIRKVDPPPPSTFRAGLPPAVDEVVLRALAKDPAGRHPDGDALADDLARLLGREPRAPSRRGRRRRGSWILIALAAAAGAAIVAVVAAAVASSALR